MMNPNKGNSSLNTLVGIIDNALSSVSTAMPVTVIQVYDNHTVDVAPMIDMLDNEGNAVEHAPISGIPYARLQGGDYGLIIQPKVGDKGLVVFASRDISDVVQSKGKAKPASLRKHSMSDGMYIASLLYEKPNTYLEITKDAVTITVPTIGNDGKNDAGKDVTNIKVEKDKVNVAVGNGIETSTLTIENNSLTITSEKITLKGDVEIIGNTTISKVLGNIATAGSKYETQVQDLLKGNLIVSNEITVNGDANIDGDAKISDVSFKDHIHAYKDGITKPPQ